MFDTSRRYPFVEAFINTAPADPGVYVLWRNNAVIYIGRAEGGLETIQSRLEEHFQGRVCSCSRQATHYSWEISLRCKTREAELLESSLVQFGQAPTCNLHIGKTARA